MLHSYEIILFIVLVTKIFETLTYEYYGTKYIPQEKYYPPAPRAKVMTDLKWIQKNVERHNYYRNFHGVPSLKLNMTLCEISQAWTYKRANGVTGHNPKRGRVGENIYTICVFGQPLQISASLPVDEWYNEEVFYDYNTGDTKVWNEQIGHFTQLVWNDSLEVGVASAEYKNSERWDCMVIVANYYPTGNVNGLFQKNVFPKRTVLSQGLRLRLPRVKIVLLYITKYFIVFFLNNFFIHV